MSNPSGLCKCGCGTKTNLALKDDPKRGMVKGEPNDYILGHQSQGKLRVDVSGIKVNESGLCKCGCGQRTSLATGTNRKLGIVKGKPRDYINGHSRRGHVPDTSNIVINESGLCLCGCGEKTPIATYSFPSKGIIKGKPVNYIRGHHRRSHQRTLEYPPLNYSGECMCGCGLPTKIATYTMLSVAIKKGIPLRYANGHGPKTAKIDRYEVTEAGWETPCWLWTGPKDLVGYGRHGGKYELAHRVFYENARGKMEDGVMLHHLCRNKACVNPDHLEPMNRSEHARRHVRERVSEETVEAIRRDCLAAIGSDKTIAAKHDVSPSFVGTIRHGRR